MKITGSEAVIKSLLEEGVDVAFGYPGGSIMPVYDAIYKYQKELKHVLVRHEQGAVHAAEGYAAATGKVGVCIATSGPGALNLMTGIADAMMDSIPLVAITGQVAEPLVGTDAFQEADVIGVTTPITKWNHQVTRAVDIPHTIAIAFHIARTGRPGPVVVDITKNAMFETTEFSYNKQVNVRGFKPNTDPNPHQIRLAAELINNAKAPLMLVGHGVTLAQAEKELLAFAEKAQIPAASTLLGLSAFPVDHPLYAGFLGMHGNYAPNMLTNQADVIIAVGMRFDDRVTGRLADYAKQAKIIHIDIDPAELNKNVKAEILIVADAKLALQELTTKTKKATRPEWLAQFAKFHKEEKKQIIDPETKPAKGAITMAEIIDTISRETRGDAVVVTDVGQNQMKSARYYRFKKNRSFISSGGAGTMGFGLPAAIGAKFGQPDREVIAVSGDGGFQMTIQELGTVMQENLPVKMVIMNNHYLGMVRQWQELFFDKRYSAVDIGQPDFVAVAKAYKISGEEVTKRSQLKEAITRMLQYQGPYLLNIFVEREENVFPMIPTGAAVDEIRLK